MPLKGLYPVEAFAKDAREILLSLGNGVEGVLNLGHLVQRFTSENDHNSFWSIGEEAKISSGLPGRRLYQDSEGLFTLLLAQYPPNTPTAIHSHEGWVVINIIEGSERYTSWTRTDDGSDPNHADLVVVQDHHIMPGEVGYLFNEPFNVHRQSAESLGALELVFMAGKGRRLFHVDEATGDCSEPIDLNR